MSGYIGTQPVPQATQTRDSFTATSNQTSFATSGYESGYIDVYLNGVKLAAADYVATNNSDVVLSVGATSGDILEVVAYTVFNVTNATDSTKLPLAGGAVTGNVTFGDSNKAIFGAGSDLNVFHNGSHSYVQDSGTGNLYLAGSNVIISNPTSSETMAYFDDDGGASLWYNNAVKIATNNTGVAVTGTATATTFQANAGGTFTTASGNDLNIVYPDGRSLFVKEGSTTHLTVDNSGNVGIGTNTPDFKLDVSHGTAANYVATFQNTADNLELKLGTTTGGNLNIQGATVNNNTAYAIGLQLDGGNVGIGVAAPAQLLHVQAAGTSGNGAMRIGGGAGLEISHDNSSNTIQRIDSLYRTTANDTNLQLRTGTLTFHTGTSSTERMRIDATGAVTMPHQPAFLAQVASAQTNLANYVNVVIFGTEIFDQNADFNPSNGIFTAPVTGKYMLSTFIGLDQIPATGTGVLQLQIAVSNRTVYAAFDPIVFDATSTKYTFTQSLLLDMDASDTAKIQIYMPASSSTVDINTDSWFSGYLVA